MTVTSVRKLGNGFHPRTAFLVYAEWDPSEPEMHRKLFPNSAEYNKLNIVCILINLIIIPRNIAMNSTG